MNLIPIIIITILALIVLWLIMKIFKPKKYSNQDFETRWRGILEKEVIYYRNLIPAEKDRFQIDILKFFDSVRVTGVDAKINDMDRLLVACSAVIPLFGYPGSTFDNISEVLIYKGSFNHNFETDGKNRNILGMVGEGAMNRHMILSKPALRNGYNQKNKSHNVGIHEFVHLLDKADGKTDGIPKFVLKSKEVKPWLAVVNGEIDDILSGKSKINPYGATNEAEFFSVASEYFFMQPEILKTNHEKLYDKLCVIYHQDPAQGLGIVL